MLVFAVIVVLEDRDGTLLICNIGNQRIRRRHLDTGIIETYAGTGRAAEDAGRRPGQRAAAARPADDGDRARRRSYLALREGHAILRIDRRTQTLHRIAGSGEQGYAGDGGRR